MPGDCILLVDDNDDDVFLTVHAFKKSNIHHEIVVAHDGAEALDLLLPTDGATPLRPVIVLLDINMPKVGGLETLARLRENEATQSLPIIMLTTSVQDADIAQSYASGANSYIAKPVTAEEFLTVARTLGVYWLDINVQVSSRFH